MESSPSFILGSVTKREWGCGGEHLARTGNGSDNKTQVRFRKERRNGRKIPSTFLAPTDTRLNKNTKKVNGSEAECWIQKVDKFTSNIAVV